MKKKTKNKKKSVHKPSSSKDIDKLIKLFEENPDEDDFLEVHGDELCSLRQRLVRKSPR